MGKIAFLFSGQGAQHPLMGKSLFENSKAARSVLLKSNKIRPNTTKQCFNGPKEILNLTQNTQPCVFCVDMAAALAAVENGIKPDCVAGFSLGELAAISFVESLNFDEALKLVCKRAELMSLCEKKNSGSMVAVLKLNIDVISKVCQNYKYAWCANFNCPSQTVVALAKEHVKDFCKDIKQLGGITIELPVSGAFHSPFMDEAASELKGYLKELNFKEPRIPIYSNITAKPYKYNEFINLLSRHINNPVLWQSTIENMINEGVDTFI